MSWNYYYTSKGILIDLIDIKLIVNRDSHYCLGSMFDLFKEDRIEKDIIDLAERVALYGFKVVSGPAGKRDEIWIVKENNGGISST